MKKRRRMIKQDDPHCRLPGLSTLRSSRSVPPITCRDGFTFIEIVAVIAILGIVAAMALPKYFSLMNEAKHKVAQAAVAEGNARVNLWGVSQYLKNGVWPTVDQYEAAADTIGTDTGEFIISYTKEDVTTLKISARGRAATNFEGIEATLRVNPPGNSGPSLFQPGGRVQMIPKKGKNKYADFRTGGGNVPEIDGVPVGNL